MEASSSRPGAGARVSALLRARLAAQREGASLPIAALLMQAFVAGVLCGLVRGDLPPFAYGVFALAISGALVAVPLLGELSGLLTADEADEWVRTLPASPFDLKLARMLHLLIALGTLTLGSALPAALLGPLSDGGRVLLLAGAFGQALLVAAVLLGVQSLFRGRAQAALVVAQTALFLFVVLGSILGLRYVAGMVGWHAPEHAPAGLAAFPPAWFAAPLSTPAAEGAGSLCLAWTWVGPFAAAASALALVLLPPPPRETARGGQPLLSLALSPVRALATRFWVAPEERGAFDLVYDALPKERDFVLRTYPLVAVPLAFLVVDREMLPVLVFTPGVWLPILLMHVPTTRSAGARWILDSAPVAPWSVSHGALKAVVVRFVLPLYALVGAVAAFAGGAGFALALVPLGFLTSVLVVRGTWNLVVADPPLSVEPEEVEVQQNLLSVLGTLAFALSVASIGALALVDRPVAALTVLVALVLLELAADRTWRRGRVST